MTKNFVRVLLVEDDDDDYLLIRDLLSEIAEPKFRLDWAKTFDQAVQQTLQQHYDVMLVDYWLGERNGLELIDLLNQHSPDAPVIILSGRGDRSLDVAALQSGAADYLDKVDLRASLLEHYIRLAIERNQALKELRDSEQRYRTLFEQESHLRQELDRTNTELKAFAYSVSHDLRAPLRSMQGFATALREDYGNQLDSLGNEYTERLVNAAHRMEHLIQALLSYSRLGEQELQRHSVDLSRLITEAQEALQADWQEQQAQIQIDQPLPLVQSDRTLLKQIVINLLSNAIKFHPPDQPPRIYIWAEKNQTWVRLWVEDNGIGIAPEHQDRIFEVFERLHGIETYTGTGIGLAIVRKGIEKLGGQSGVESMPDQGSRFWIDIPRGEPSH